MPKHAIAVIAFDRISPFHLAVPCVVFGDVHPGVPPFRLMVCAGEDAIREWFRTSGLLERHDFTPAQRADFERYEGNAQGFRILTHLKTRPIPACN